MGCAKLFLLQNFLWNKIKKIMIKCRVSNVSRVIHTIFAYLWINVDNYPRKPYESLI